MVRPGGAEWCQWWPPRAVVVMSEPAVKGNERSRSVGEELKRD